MATRSTIARKLEDGTIKQIYCHWDGYPANNGKILMEHYTDPEKIDELLNLGSISILGKEVKPPEGETHTFDKPLDDVTVAYHRDRDEDWEHTQPKIYKRSETRQGEEFDYLFKDGKWYFSDHGSRFNQLKESHIKRK